MLYNKQYFIYVFSSQFRIYSITGFQKDPEITPSLDLQIVRDMLIHLASIYKYSSSNIIGMNFICVDYIGMLIQAINKISET